MQRACDENQDLKNLIIKNTKTLKSFAGNEKPGRMAITGGRGGGKSKGVHYGDLDKLVAAMSEMEGYKRR